MAWINRGVTQRRRKAHKEKTKFLFVFLPEKWKLR